MNSTSNTNTPDTTLTMEKMREVIEKAREMLKDTLRAVVITEKYSPQNGVYQVPTDDGIYILSNRITWDAIVHEIKNLPMESQPWNIPWSSNYPDTLGAPVIEDEELAEKVMAQAMREWEQREWMEKIREDFMKETWSMDAFRISTLFRTNVA